MRRTFGCDLPHRGGPGRSGRLIQHPRRVSEAHSCHVSGAPRPRHACDARPTRRHGRAIAGPRDGSRVPAPRYQPVLGFRSLVGVPMLRDGEAIGAIAIGRSMVGSFPASQIELLQTFADQAVIAIENVRLFTELQEKNRASPRRTRSDRVAGAADGDERDPAGDQRVRRPIAQPVFEAIVRDAVRLCGALQAVCFGSTVSCCIWSPTKISPRNGSRTVRRMFPRSVTAPGMLQPRDSRRAVVRIDDLEDGSLRGRLDRGEPFADVASEARWPCRCSGRASPSAQSLWLHR